MVFLVVIEGGILLGIIDDFDMFYLGIVVFVYDLYYSCGLEFDDIVNINCVINVICFMIEECYGDEVCKKIYIVINVIMYFWCKWVRINDMGKILCDVDLMVFYLDCLDFIKEFF